VSDDSLALMTELDPSEASIEGILFGMGTFDLGYFPGMHGIGNNGWYMGYLGTVLTRPDSGVTVGALTNDERLQGFWATASGLADIAEECASS
jgi:hypothetical protein